MQVGERVVAARAEAEPQLEIGWFAARQPGVMRFLEDRLGAGAPRAQGADDEVLAIALDAACAIAEMFTAQHGRPPPRLSPRALERAEEQALEALAQRRPGYAERQPGLAAWVAGLVADPPRPLSRDQRRALGLSLGAVIAGFDAVLATADETDNPLLA